MFKYIIFESDDWGSIRMSTSEARKELIKQKFPLDEIGSEFYNEFDCVESMDDLTALFEVLSKHKDCAGNHPIFTPLHLVTNPDFEKIKENNYNQYFYETIDKTYERFNRGQVLETVQQGISSDLYHPEFHGREHLNVPVWMRALLSQDPDTLTAFNYGIWGFINRNKHGVYYQAAYDLENPNDIPQYIEIVNDGLELFERLFHYKAKYFVPPNGPFTNALLKTLADRGIRLIASDLIQREPIGYGKIKRNIRFTGMKNRLGQRFIKRNCFFEPSNPQKNWVDSCLQDIERAFLYKKPAIISTHRVNYVGGMVARNRENGLRQLDELIEQILKRWPDVEFKTTNELYDYFEKLPWTVSRIRGLRR